MTKKKNKNKRHQKKNEHITNKDESTEQEGKQIVFNLYTKFLVIYSKYLLLY